MDVSASGEQVAEPIQLNLDHLFRMTDGTGMIQHSLFSTPDPKYGYCIDDNARALKFVVRYYRLTQDDAALPLIYTYLSFIRYAQTPDGRFHNFMSFDREWLDRTGSDDSFGRAVMGLCYAVAMAPEPGVGAASAELLRNARGWIPRLTSPRSVAFSLLGLGQLAGTQLWDAEWQDLLRGLASYLAALYQANAQDDWRWFEDILTYCNARIPQSLIVSSAVMQNPEWGAVGLESLDFYLDQVLADGRLEIVGHDGWYPRGGKKAVFDQQPVDAGGLVEACLSAAQASADGRYLRSAGQAMEWYTGRNRLGLSLIDPVTGGCFDGLQPDGLNANQGAESLLAYLNARLALEEFARGVV